MTPLLLVISVEQVVIEDRCKAIDIPSQVNDISISREKGEEALIISRLQGSDEHKNLNHRQEKRLYHHQTSLETVLLKYVKTSQHEVKPE